MDQNFVKKLKDFFADKADVLAVWIFGSQAKKTAGPLSDVDVALLYATEKIPNFTSQLTLKEELTSLLKKEVDLVVLNEANPILKHQVYKSGVVVLKKNTSFYNRFFVRSLNEYDDLKRVRHVIESNLLKRRVYG